MASIPVLSSLVIDGTLTVDNIAAGVSDYDRFLVSDGGLIKYRTGAQVLSDIGGSSQTLALGTDNQIPVMNSGGTDFEYNSAFVYDATTNTMSMVDTGNTAMFLQNTTSTNNAYYRNYNLVFTDSDSSMTLNANYLQYNSGGWQTQIQFIAPTAANDIFFPDAGGTLALVGAGAVDDRYLRSDVADSANGLITFTAGSTYSGGTLTLNNNIILGLGTVSDFYTNGTSTLLDMSSGNFVLRDGTTTRFTFERTSGDFIATGGVSSDYWANGGTGSTAGSASTIFTERSMPVQSLVLVSNTTSSTGFPYEFSQGLYIKGANETRDFALLKRAIDNDSKLYLGYKNVSTWTWTQFITQDNASTELTQFLLSDVADVKTSGDLTFNDGVRVILGTGGDAELFHSVDNNYFDINNGDFFIRDINGATTTRFTFGRTTGDLTMTGNLDLQDSDKILLGTSDDMQISHEVTENRIRLNNGDLVINDTGATRFTFGRTSGDLTLATGTYNGDGSGLTGVMLATGVRTTGDASAILINSVRPYDISSATDEPSGSNDGIITTGMWDSTAYAAQQFHDFHNNTLWLRQRNASVWGSWAKVLTDTNASTELGQFLRSDVADTKTAGNLIFNTDIRLQFGSSAQSDVRYSTGGMQLNVDNLNNGTDNLVVRKQGVVTHTFNVQNGDFIATGDITANGDLDLNGNLSIKEIATAFPVYSDIGNERPFITHASGANRSLTLGVADDTVIPIYIHLNEDNNPGTSTIVMGAGNAGDILEVNSAGIDVTGTGTYTSDVIINTDDRYFTGNSTLYKFGGSTTIGVRLGTATGGGVDTANQPEIDFRRWTGTGTVHNNSRISATRKNGSGAWGLGFYVSSEATNVASSTVGMYIDTTQQVGIKTNNPGYDLDVNGDIRSNILLTDTLDNTAVTASWAKFDGYGVLANRAALYVSNSGVIILQANQTTHTSSNPDLYINTSGNVSLNNTNDTYRLDVNGTGRFQDDLTVRRTAVDGTVAKFTDPHIKLEAGTTGDNSGYVGISMATSTSTNYGYTVGAQRTTGGQGDFYINFHNNSALGTTRFFIDESGNVGIGNTNNTYKLDVSGTGRFTGKVHIGTGFNTAYDLNIGTGGLGVEYSKGIEFTGVSILGSRINASSSNDLLFSTRATGTPYTLTERMRINNFSGNVSIGNTNNTYKLDVSGTGRFTDNLTIGTTSTEKKITTYFSDSSYTEIHGYGIQFNRTASYLRPTATGKNLKIGNGATNNWSIIQSWADDHYWYNASDSQKMRLFSTGNLSINNNTDSGYRLDVSGTGRFTGNVTLDDNAKLGFGTSNGESQIYSNGTHTYWDAVATKDIIIRESTTTRVTIDTGTGDITANDFILSSDKKLKQKIRSLKYTPIDVHWKTFEMNADKGQKRYGVVAQDLEETHPEFVRTSEEGTKSVAYIDLLVAKIAELEQRIKTLENGCT